MSSVTETAQNIREDMNFLAAPTESFGLVDWVNERAKQFAKIGEKHGLVVEKLYLQVNPEDFPKSLEKAYVYPTEIEMWDDVAQGTYRVEFETNNDQLDTVLGVFNGVYGKVSDAETTWVLWRKDQLEVQAAQEIAPKL